MYVIYDEIRSEDKKRLRCYNDTGLVSSYVNNWPMWSATCSFSWQYHIALHICRTYAVLLCLHCDFIGNLRLTRLTYK